MRYVDFDLLIEAGEHGFEARVLSSPAGEARHEFGLPFTPVERNELLLRLAQDTRPGRGFNKDATLAAKELGGRLFEAVFDEDVGARLLSSIQSAEAEEYGLRIRLRIEAPELAQLPWEYLYDARLNQFLALSRSTSVVRYLELPRPPRPLHVVRPLTMLVLISNPKDYPELKAQEEWENLNIALGRLPEGVVEIERVEPTLAALRARLRRGPVHVLHFIGHGEFDEAAQDGLIVLEDDKGNSFPVSSEKLAVILNNHPSIRLAVLNCCEGARSSVGNPFSGVAPALIQKGLPAVVAMQFAIADTAAITFASNFYQGIADGLAIDDALVEARTSMFVTADEEAFGAPVLYTRSHDGVLFDPETPGEGTARPKARKTSPSRFWNGRSIDSTRLHERSAEGDPTVLIVLVHGPDGDPVKTWRDIPKWVLEAVGDDADVLSYATPDLTAHDAVAEAARGLRRVLLARPCFSMHLFFLAQGSGAAVVRELLAADVESVRQQRIGILAQMPPIAAKTRVVFQFPAERKPARRKAAKRKAPPEPASQDTSGGAALNGRLQRSLNRLRANDFPRPRLVQFAADEDFVAIEGHEDVVELIPENGSEKTTDLPSRREDLRVEAMAELMRPYFHSPDMAVSYVTLRRMVGLDGRIEPIAEAADFSARSETPAADAWIGSSGSQQQALQWLRELSAPDRRGEHPRILITGSAGVGKSTVLRRHARCVTTRFLERQDAAQLCMYIPMQSATLDGNQKKAMLLGVDPALRWRALCEYAVTLFREILLDPEEETAFADDEPPTDTDSWKSVGDLFTVEWAEQDATSGPSVVVWDGIDEFLVNYSALTVDTIAELLGVIEGTSQHARTQCLLAARITLPAIRELSRHRDVYEILPLSERTAETWFPGLHRLLKDLPDGDLRRLLLSPLVLVRLSPLAARIDQQSLAGRVAMLRYALNTLIGQSRLPKLRSSTNGSPTDGWFQALALTAWAMYSDGLGSIEMTALTARIQRLREVWSSGADAAYQRFAQGFAVFESEATVSALRSRTVLDSLGRGGVRFTHREWQDSLLAYYFAQCAPGRMFSELDLRGFTKQVYIDAAENLWRATVDEGIRIDSEWIDSLLNAASPATHPTIFTNVCALLGNGPTDVDQSALGKLMEVICDEQTPEVVRLVAVSGFGMRILRADERDQSIKYMREDLTDAFSRIIGQGDQPGRKVSASMAWCYRAALDRRFGTRRENEPWPELNPMTREGMAAAGAGGMWEQQGDKLVVDIRRKLYQIAAAQHPLAVRGLPDEEISLTHYLFLVTATLKARVAASEIFPLLRAVFAEESGVAARIERYPLPEVRKLFASCREAAQRYIPEAPEHS